MSLEVYSQFVKTTLELGFFFNLKYVIVSGNSAVEYMYTQLRFKWNEVDYSLFSTSEFIIHVTGSCR